MSDKQEDIRQIDKMRSITDYIHRAGFVAMNDALQKKVMKLSLRQCAVLACIRRYTTIHPEGVSMSVLAERVNMSPSAASHMIDSLMSLGMVERRQSPTDRRAVLVTIASTFQNPTSTVEEAQKNAIAELRAGLTEEEQRVFDTALDKIYAAVIARDNF